MYVKNSIEQWDQIIEEFKSYDATATKFCKEKKYLKVNFITIENDWLINK